MYIYIYIYTYNICMYVYTYIDTIKPSSWSCQATWLMNSWAASQQLGCSSLRCADSESHQGAVTFIHWDLCHGRFVMLWDIY